MTIADVKAAFAAILKPDQISDSAAKNAAYASDWTKSNVTTPQLVLFPKTTEDVVRIVKLANSKNLSLIPTGGRSGLAGGVSVLADEVVVSLEKMDNIIEYDPIDRVVRCEAGVITQTLQDFVKSKGDALPLDLAARGTSQLGGNIATNAGGLNVVRNGMVRSWVAGLRVVTGSGEELDLQCNLIKDNSGYNLVQPFIGSEGTLGIITEVSLWLTTAPKDTRVLSFCTNDVAATLQTYQLIRDNFDLQAFEIFDQRSYRLVLDSFGMKAAFPKDKTVYVVLEIAATPDWEERISELLSSLSDPDIAATAMMGQSDAEKQSLWSYREKIAEAVVRNVHYQSDISVRTSKIFGFIDAMTSEVRKSIPEIDFLWFGHIGDGNLHIVALNPAGQDTNLFSKGRTKLIDLTVTLLKTYKGSFSAEHGVGLLKKDLMKRLKTPFEMAYHRNLKGFFDPKGILNPGKVIDP